jgi:hypothetical protein
MDCGRVDEAIATCRQSMADGTATPSVRYTLARALLKSGDLAEGFNYYEWRFEGDEPFLPAPVFPRPRWDGGDLTGRTILVYDEQGAGDTIQFSRYIPLLVERGGRVLLHCRSSLVRLLSGKGLSGSVERGGLGVSAIIKEEDVLPPFDVHSPLMSLPLLFKTTLKTIPAKVPYLFADPARAAGWEERVAATAAGQLKVGVVWAGNPEYKNNRRRSFAPSLLGPLLKVPGVRFFSLQMPAKIGPAVNASRAAAEMGMTDWTAELTDFADTAALVANLDLVISVDTSVAHLTGAMGRPIWMLTPMNNEWRWMIMRQGTPWYPTMRLFRQDRWGDWTGPIDRVAEALRALVQERAA